MKTLIIIALSSILILESCHREKIPDNVQDINIHNHDASKPQQLTFDTMPPGIPRSKNPYYPDREVPSQVEGYIISGGRFDEFDLTNIVYHANIRRDSSGILERLGDSWVDFFDMDNQLVGSFNITANNPYNPKKYKNFLSEGYTDWSKSVVDRTVYPNYDWRTDVDQYATSGGTYENRNCANLVIAYYLQALDEDRTLLGVVATFVLLDNTGKEIARFKDLEDVSFGEGILTCDHKYFCLRYGGSFTVDDGRMYNDHFRIYDVQTKEIVYDWELPPNHQLNGPAEQLGGWVMVHQQISYKEQKEKGYTTSQIKLAFDLKNRMKYSSPIDARLNYIRAFTEDGFIIQDQQTKAFERVRYRDWPAEKF